MIDSRSKRSVHDDLHELDELRKELKVQAHVFKAETRDKLDDLEERCRAIERILRALEAKSAKR